MTDPPELTLGVLRYVLSGVMAFAVLLTGLLLWAVGVTIAGAIIVPGEVVSDRRVVQHPQGGVLVEVLVEEGDIVAPGEVLARLDTGYQQAELAMVEEHLFEIAVRQARLRAEFSGADLLRFPPTLAPATAEQRALMADERALFQAGRDSLRSQMRQLDQKSRQLQIRATGLDAQIRAVARQLALANATLASQRALVDKGVAPAISLVPLEREQAGLAGQLGELRASHAETTEQQAGIAVEQTRASALYRQEAIRAMRDTAPASRQYRTEAMRLRREIAQARLLAPAGGVVFGVQGRSAQTVLRPAEPLLHVLPHGAGRRITARIGVGQVDQVGAGQRVTLRLSAVDRKVTPKLSGQVVRVAAAPSEDPRGGAPFFEVEVRLDPRELSKLPPGTVLLPGMPVETYIRTTDRSPLAYLVKPVTDYFARAFREG